ncbi:Tryptophan--tRNA ligase, mitochondrial [Neopestalotiopsis sp. 37M]|nr:Tryptophan--tRNA ligase, mitochondrial [Neopestalotiopsis sp. 37M]
MSIPACARCRPSAASRHLRRLLSGASQTPQSRRSFSSIEPAADDATAAAAAASTPPQHATIFSGIQPTGVPHLGNYLGAMRQWKRLQDAAGPGDRLYFSIVDLHAITMPQDAPVLRQRSREMLAVLMATGLDPERCTMFYQSAVPAHSELMWILSSETPRVMSLQNPKNKMSKSATNHRSRILVTASPDEIRSRIKGAVTDAHNSVSYDPEARPGVANLLELWSQCDPQGRSPLRLAADCQGMGLGDLKRQVGDAIVGELEGIGERYEEILDRRAGQWVEQIQAAGAERARRNADETMRMVRDAVGLAGF